LLKRQAKDGYFYDSAAHLPIVQGQFDVTGNALVALEWGASNGADARLKPAANRALTWIATHVPTTTQDKVFKVISVMRYGNPEQKKSAWSTVESLTREQQEDGGWKEIAALDGSNAFATGQVLYAYQQAGVSVLSPTFQRGVQYLLKTQVNDASRDNGIWRAIKTQSQDLTELAPTMWAVIGLAAAYSEEVPGALQVGEPQAGRAATRNLEIVLDVSGSMNANLGPSTRWLTALEVLKKFVATIPADFNVALRVYGHRYPSKSLETCTDTELIVPLGKLDRDKIISTVSALKPRGETPLVLLYTRDHRGSPGREGRHRHSRDRRRRELQGRLADCRLQAEGIRPRRDAQYRRLHPDGTGGEGAAHNARRLDGRALFRRVERWRAGECHPAGRAASDAIRPARCDRSRGADRQYRRARTRAAERRLPHPGQVTRRAAGGQADDCARTA
jgi:hypothetical protein